MTIAIDKLCRICKCVVIAYLDNEVMFMDCNESPLLQLENLTREVLLPLLCSDTARTAEYGVSADKLMDILHRLMSSAEVARGAMQGEVILSLPSIEVLAAATATNSRHPSITQIIETVVIGWMKQIRVGVYDKLCK